MTNPRDQWQCEQVIKLSRNSQRPSGAALGGKQVVQDSQMADDMGQQQRTALVTGSSNGIGEAIVKHLARLDFKLVVTGRDAGDIGRVADACQRISPSSSRPLELVANLEFEDDTRRLFDVSLSHFGGRLDLLVNNAGYTEPQEAGASELQMYSHFKKTMQVNLNSAVHLTLLARAALESTARLYEPPRPTSIIQISSMAASRPLENYAYCVSKCAMSMFSNCISAHLAPLVRVNTIAPGPIETKIIERSGHSMEVVRAHAAQLTPLGRMGQPDEVAHAVLFLADPERASYITGAQLTIDGGTSWAQIKMS